MTRPPAIDRGYPLLARLLARDITGWPARIARAHEVMNDARSPLRANSYEALATSNGGPDPGQTAIAAQATRQRKELDNAIDTIDGIVRHVTCILDEWAPAPTHSALTIWCENHLRYGQHVTRADDGSTNCGWCSNVHRAYKAWPTRQLIDMHDRGRRISETEYRRLLGKGAVA